MTVRTPQVRIDWKAERERLDLASIATGLLGPAPGRRGERGRRLWWRCPFHPDENPSFEVDPGKPFWTCRGCGARGDAANLVMRLEGLSFPEAVRKLLGGYLPAPVGPSQDRAPRPATTPAPPPSGLPAAEALACVERAEAALWSPEGAEALAELTGRRGLTPGTIRKARLGWTPRLDLMTRDGRAYTARGTVIPWFDGDRLSLVKLRQPDGRKPKYAEAYRDRPTTFPALPAEAGLPLVLCEGELDSLLLGQELAGLARVETLGSASSRLDHDILAGLLGCPRWYLGTDGDPAGDKAASLWPPGRSTRVRPPGQFKDWTEARQAGVNLRRWWTDRLAGVEEPDLFSWPELAAMRWGPAFDDPEPGIIVY